MAESKLGDNGDDSNKVPTDIVEGNKNREMIRS